MNLRFMVKDENTENREKKSKAQGQKWEARKNEVLSKVSPPPTATTAREIFPHT